MPMMSTQASSWRLSGRMGSVVKISQSYGRKKGTIHLNLPPYWIWMGLLTSGSSLPTLRQPSMASSSLPPVVRCGVDDAIMQRGTTFLLKCGRVILPKHHLCVLVAESACLCLERLEELELPSRAAANYATKLRLALPYLSSCWNPCVSDHQMGTGQIREAPLV